MKNTTETNGTQKHTQGPWHLGIRAGERGVYGPQGEEVAVTTPMIQNYEILANARLIAAAPELLDSVKFALTLAREDLAQAVAEGALEDGMHMAAVRRIVESFENVISKAEGA